MKPSKRNLANAAKRAEARARGVHVSTYARKRLGVVEQHLANHTVVNTPTQLIVDDLSGLGQALLTQAITEATGKDTR